MPLNISKLNKAINESKFPKTEIASRCNLDRKTIENVLAGRDPKMSTVVALASVLELKISYLFDEEMEVRKAGRDYVEAGGIQHNKLDLEGSGVNEADLREQIAQLKSQLEDKERIIRLLEGRR